MKLTIGSFWHLWAHRGLQLWVALKVVCKYENPHNIQLYKNKTIYICLFYDCVAMWLYTGGTSRSNFSSTINYRKRRIIRVKVYDFKTWLLLVTSGSRCYETPVICAVSWAIITVLLTQRNINTTRALRAHTPRAPSALASTLSCMQLGWPLSTHETAV